MVAAGHNGTCRFATTRAEVMMASKDAVHVLLLDPVPRFLPDLSDQLCEIAKGHAQKYHVVPVESPESALKELEGKDPSYWAMFLVNQDFLQNGGASASLPPLVQALRGQFVQTPVAILSDDEIADADDAYKGLRMQPLGRPGYTTYILPQSLFAVSEGNGHPIQQSMEETTAVQMLGNGAFQFSFTSTPGATFTVLSTTNLSLPLSNWTVVGVATNTAPGVFQFTTQSMTNGSQQFYIIRLP